MYQDAKYVIQYSRDSVIRAKEASRREEEIIRIGVSPMTPVKEKLTFRDLYGENLLLMRRGWSGCVDSLRNELYRKHPQIHVTDFEFYNVEVFNRCENSNNVFLAIKNWESVHPLMKIIPVEWDCSIPFGLLYAPEPSKKVRRLLSAIEKVVGEI